MSVFLSITLKSNFKKHLCFETIKAIKWLFGLPLSIFILFYKRVKEINSINKLDFNYSSANAQT